MELESEKILPIEDRIKELYSSNNSDVNCIEDWESKYGGLHYAVTSLDKYHKALEVAEIKCVQLQDKLYKAEQLAISRGDQLDKIEMIADERYNKAYSYYQKNVFDKSVEGTLYHDEVDKAIKLAAYGN